MAAPTYQAVGAKAEGIGDLSVSWPVHATGDVGFLFIEYEGAGTASTPAGWTLLSLAPQTTGDIGSPAGVSMAVYWKRAASAAEASVTYTDTGQHTMGVILTVRGAAASGDPVHAVGADVTGAPGTACTFPSATTTVPDCLVLLAVANGDGWDATGYTNAALTGITERFDDFTGVSGNGGISIATATYAGPGATGTTSATMGSSVWQARFTIAVTSVAASTSSTIGSLVGSQRGSVLGSIRSSAAAAVGGGLQLLGTPVVSSRVWTSGLAPDGADWKFIYQSFNYGSSSPPEWVVLDLTTGTKTIDYGPADIFATSTYQVWSNLSSVDLSDAVGGNQLRASNGRIFFPCKGLNVAYYDPTDERVHFIPTVSDPGRTHAGLYSAIFGDDGNVYMASQTDSGTGSDVAVIKVNPTTAAATLLGHVGTLPNDLLYGYRIAVEDSATHVYVAVGQNPWELWSLNVATGVSSKLTPAGYPGPYTFIEFNERAEGWTARFVTSGGSQDFWLVDGVLYPGAPTYPPSSGSFVPRTVTPAGPSALVSAPEVDWSGGSSSIAWRPRGSSGAYTTIAVSGLTVEPIPLDALHLLPDGNSFGTAQQYNGFYRSSGAAPSWLLGHLISQPAFANRSATQVYFTGYPNGPLWLYNPTTTWIPGTNPGQLAGTWYPTAGVKYAYWLFWNATTSKLYMGGRLERSDQGTGIGTYDPSTLVFTGNQSAPLDLYVPRGMVMLSTPGLLVCSGTLLSGSGTAKLEVFDLSLVHQRSITVQSGLANTGTLYLDPGNTSAVVGIATDINQMYRANAATGAVLSTASISGIFRAACQHPDGRIAIVLGSTLYTVNPTTLAQTPIASLAVTPSLMAWSGSTLYLTTSATLYKMTLA